MNYIKIICIKKTLVSFFLFLTLFSFSLLPVKASAGDFILVGKEFVTDAIAWELANTFLKKITAQTVNWINSGFKGSPAYIKNPQQFFLSVADEQASRFLSDERINNICTPFRAQVRLALVRSYLDQDNENYTCSLGILRNNYENFMSDFDQAGWGGWFELTQIDANNPYGAASNAQKALSVQIGQQEGKFKEQLGYSGGFLSWDRCPEGFENVTPANNFGDCLVEKETVTPGKLIADTLHTNVTIGTKRLETADELNEIISALFNQLMGRIIGGIGNGLFGASQSGGGGGGGGAGPSFTEQLATEAPPPTPSSPNINIPPCPADLGYPCETLDNNGGGAECTPYPTDEERLQAQGAMDSIIYSLNDPTNLTLCPRAAYSETNPPPAECQQAATTVTNDANAAYPFPSVAALYYPYENTIALHFGYIVGPNQTQVSNLILPGDTWRWTWRVFSEDCGTTGGGTTNSLPNSWNVTGALNPADVNIVAADAGVLGWPETTQITGGNWGNEWDINFTAETTWPACKANSSQATDVQFTIWLFLNINGAWYGSAFERNYIGDQNAGGPGVPQEQLPKNWYYDARWAPMYGHVLQPGEEVAFMVTNGNQRPTDGLQCGNGQRSNIVKVKLP